MQELKIVCYCGQKYKFDVEPVNGKMPFTVKCPVCNTDGTGRANEMLAQQYATPPRPSPPPPGSISLPPGFTMIQPATAAPSAPVAPMAAAPPPPRPVTAAAPLPVGFNPPPPPPVASAPPPLPAGYSISRPPVAAAPPLVAAGMGAVAEPPPIPARAPVPVRQMPKVAAPVQFNMTMGLVGAAAGALVGCGLMYAFFSFAGFRFPLTGVAVGVCAGFMARWLAKGGDNTLGIITAVLAAGSVAGTLFLMYGEFPVLNIVSVVVAGTMANRLVAR